MYIFLYLIKSDATAETYIRIILIKISSTAPTKFEAGTPISAFALEPGNINGICIPIIFRKNYEWFISAASWDTDKNIMVKENGSLYVYFITNTYLSKEN